MQKTWKTPTLFAVLAVLAGAIVFSSSETVDARPQIPHRVPKEVREGRGQQQNYVLCLPR